MAAVAAAAAAASGGDGAGDGGGMRRLRPPGQRVRQGMHEMEQAPCCATFDPAEPNLLLEALHEPESAVGMAARECFNAKLTPMPFQRKMCELGFHTKRLQCIEFRKRMRLS